MKKLYNLFLILSFGICLSGCGLKLVDQKADFSLFPIEYDLYESVNTDLIKIEQTYSDGSKKYVSPDSFSGFDNLTGSVGKHVVTIGKDGKYYTQNVFVYSGDSAYCDEWRSQYHYSNANGWLNDPCGLVYNEKTNEWHMYYQKGPRMGSDPLNYWSVREWGHAVSNDLVHWSYEGIAIPRENDGFGDIWSGCCVVDENNTTGLFPSYVAPEERIVAIYSVTRPQQQYCMGYSLDGGYTFIKYSKNPVIDNSLAQYGGGFRDSKCYWVDDETMENGGYWLLATAGDGCRLWTSPNLINWTFNEFVTDKNGVTVGYECPMFHPFELDDDPNNIKYVFSDGGTYYIVGSLVNINGKVHFMAETDHLIFNGSASNYATMDWHIPHSKRCILTSWISDYYMQDYPNKTPNRPWEGMMSLPLEAKLKTDKETLLPRLFVEPIEEIDDLLGDVLFEENDFITKDNYEETIPNIESSTIKIEVSGLANISGQIGFKLRSNEEKYLDVGFDIDKGIIYVNNERTGVGRARDTMEVPVDNGGSFNITIYLDTSCVEIFYGQGEGALSSIYFTDGINLNIKLYTTLTTLFETFRITSMNSIWHKNGRTA